MTQEAGGYTESRWAQEMGAYRKQAGTASRAGQKQQPGHWIPLKARIDEGFSWAPFPNPRPRAALGIWVWKKQGDRAEPQDELQVTSLLQAEMECI